MGNSHLRLFSRIALRGALASPWPNVDAVWGSWAAICRHLPSPVPAGSCAAQVRAVQHISISSSLPIIRSPILTSNPLSVQSVYCLSRKSRCASVFLVELLIVPAAQVQSERWMLVSARDFDRHYVANVFFLEEWIQ